MIQLVTDRTAADVSRAKILAAKPYANMTAAERAEYTAGLKGCYNASDLNRVGAAQAELKTLIAEYGYNAVLAPKTDWAGDGEPEAAAMAAYLAATDALREAFFVAAGTPDLPGSMSRLTYTGANNIELVLTALQASATALPNGYVYSGEIYAGE